MSWIYRVGDLFCFTAFLFFGPYSCRFKVYTFTYLFTYFVTQLPNEPVDTPSKERRHQAFHTTLLLHHDASSDLITIKLRYGHVLPINHHHVAVVGHLIMMIMIIAFPIQVKFKMWIM